MRAVPPTPLPFPRRPPRAGRGLLCLALAIAGSACSLPRVPGVSPRVPDLAQTSVLVDDRGHVITSLHAEQNRTAIPIGDIPRSMRDAVIAMEDQRFWTHHGVDVKAIVRAALADVSSGSVEQGGSTITEQLVKNTITGSDRTLSRKIRDALLAYELETRYSKSRILELYLNTVYFGQGAYGVEAAAHAYFSESARTLTVPQSALLAGIIASPSAFDPIFHQDAALARRRLALERMRSLGMIDAPTFAGASASTLGLKVDDRVRYPAPYFVDYVKRWFLSNPRFGTTYDARYRALFAGGLRIETTVDLAMQREAETAVSSILAYRTDPYGAMTVLDPRTGAIRAMVGGRDYFGNGPFAKLNLATGGATGRQAGSSFKPFTLVTALRRAIAPTAVYPAPPHLAIPLPRGSVPPVWDVSNYDGEGGGRMTLEEATIKSVNTVYAQLIMQVGPQNVVDTARAMGITTPMRAVPSAVLGTNDVNTLEMASAYGTLATMGRHAEPFAVSRVVAPGGRVLYDAAPALRQVVEPGVAWITDQILEKVVQRGTGTAASIPRPAAGKTGTAQDWRDAWFVGFVPQLVAAVWVGFPKAAVPMVAPRVRLAHVTGGSWPAEIWHAFMVKALAGVRPEPFERPDFRFVTVAVDTSRGCLPNAFTVPTDVRRIRYIEGTEPTLTCDEPVGAQVVPVPDVVGMSQRKAESVMAAWGLRVQETGPPGEAWGPVAGQDPQPGSEALQGSLVTLAFGAVPGATPSPSPSPSASPSPSPSPSPSGSPSPSPSASPAR